MIKELRNEDLIQASIKNHMNLFKTLYYDNLEFSCSCSIFYYVPKEYKIINLKFGHLDFYRSKQIQDFSYGALKSWFDYITDDNEEQKYKFEF